MRTKIKNEIIEELYGEEYVFKENIEQLCSLINGKSCLCIPVCSRHQIFYIKENYERTCFGNIDEALIAFLKKNNPQTVIKTLNMKDRISENFDVTFVLGFAIQYFSLKEQKIIIKNLLSSSKTLVLEYYDYSYAKKSRIEELMYNANKIILRKRYKQVKKDTFIIYKRYFIKSKTFYKNKTKIFSYNINKINNMISDNFSVLGSYNNYHLDTLNYKGRKIIVIKNREEQKI